MNLRDQIEVELKGAVAEHDRIRAELKRIDALSAHAADFTLGVRHALLSINHRYNAIRQLLAKETVLGELDQATAQRSVGSLELFAHVPEEMSAGERERMVRSLHAAGDHSMDREGEE